MSKNSSNPESKIVGATALSLLGLSVLSFGGYKTYNFFNSDKKMINMITNIMAR